MSPGRTPRRPRNPHIRSTRLPPGDPASGRQTLAYDRPAGEEARAVVVVWVTAVAWVGFLAQQLPHVVGVAKKIRKYTYSKVKGEWQANLWGFF